MSGLRSVQGVANVKAVMEELPCCLVAAATVRGLVDHLSNTELGFVVAYGLCVDIFRGRLESNEGSLEFLASLVSGNSLADTERARARNGIRTDTVRTLRRLLKEARPLPGSTRGRNCSRTPDLCKVVPFRYALEACTVGKPYGIEWGGYASFRRDLKRRSKKGGLRGNIVKGTGDVRFFVSTCRSVEGARVRLRRSERRGTAWPGRLRDLLGLWGFEDWQYIEMVMVGYDESECNRYTPRTATFFDAGAAHQFVPHKSSDGWGRTVDAREPSCGVAEAMADSRLGGGCTLIYIGESTGKTQTTDLAALNRLLGSEYNACV